MTDSHLVRWSVPMLLALGTGACGLSVHELAERYPVVPHPAELEPADGDFTLDGSTRILLSHPDDPELDRLAREHLARPLRRASGLPLGVDALPPGSEPVNALVLRLEGGDADEARSVRPVGSIPEPASSVGAGGGDAGEGSTGPVPPSVTGEIPAGRGASAEAYELRVSERRVELSASTHAGIFRGLQTLRQLLPPEVDVAIRELAPWSGDVTGPSGDVPIRIPAVEIRDAPRFAWRGMHLDVGRHFFPVEFVKKYVDLLALHRMNTFHWHLTEDQGWRIEIERYPRLTEVGGCRPETMVEKNFEPFVGDGTEYCGYYTQDEIREVVAYAADRHVTVVPEIEMPGHSLAALAAYPELACTEGPFEVGTRWGVYEDIYCPSEETFAFLEGVLTEVIELFPSRYIHIGGDEAPKARWEESPVAQEIIRREGLADEAELQSWFIRRIEAFLAEHGRRLVGWDEILEGGLAPDATV
ncbi:MAG TPA: beta-N-acetylhexosaminidase, partial [Longimicrobiales bacterium]|nr:beta-N-acetylhexosaminidase [Longimicrobiales bacterium]